MSTPEDDSPAPSDVVERIMQALKSASPRLGLMDSAGRRQLGAQLAPVAVHKSVRDALYRLGGLVRADVLEESLEGTLSPDRIKGRIEGVAVYLSALEDLVQQSASLALDEIEAEEATKGGSKGKRSVLAELSALAGAGESGLAVGDWDEGGD